MTSSITKPPITYAEWADCLSQLTQGNLQLTDLPTLDAGQLEWSRGSAERFSQRFSDTYNTVLDQCAQRLQHKLQHQATNELDLIQALNQTRRALTLLFKVSLVNPIPDELRSHLQATVDAYAQQAQSSLEQSAGCDRSGKLAALIKHHSLLKFDRSAVTPESSPALNQGLKGSRKPVRRLLS